MEKSGKEEINVRDFICEVNDTPYDGDELFLAGPTKRTTDLWNEVQRLQKLERGKRWAECWSARRRLFPD